MVMFPVALSEPVLGKSEGEKEGKAEREGKSEHPRAQERRRHALRLLPPPSSVGGPRRYEESDPAAEWQPASLWSLRERAERENRQRSSSGLDRRGARPWRVTSAHRRGAIAVTRYSCGDQRHSMKRGRRSRAGKASSRVPPSREESERLILSRLMAASARTLRFRICLLCSSPLTGCNLARPLTGGSLLHQERPLPRQPWRVVRARAVVHHKHICSGSPRPWQRCSARGRGGIGVRGESRLMRMSEGSGGERSTWRGRRHGRRCWLSASTAAQTVTPIRADWAKLTHRGPSSSSWSDGLHSFVPWPSLGPVVLTCALAHLAQLHAVSPHGWLGRDPLLSSLLGPSPSSAPRPAPVRRAPRRPSLNSQAAPTRAVLWPRQLRCLA